MQALAFHLSLECLAVRKPRVISLTMNHWKVGQSFHLHRRLCDFFQLGEFTLFRDPKWRPMSMLRCAFDEIRFKWKAAEESEPQSGRFCHTRKNALGVPSPFFPGIRIFLENLRKPRGNGSGFWKERWLKRMGNQPLEMQFASSAWYKANSHCISQQQIC